MKICHVNEVLCLSFYCLNIPIHFNRQSVTKVPFMYNNAFARHSPVSSDLWILIPGNVEEAATD